MKKIICILSILCTQVCIAQNLVPNPSFEDTINCPQFIGDIDRAIGWSSYGITPDYFNSCAQVSLGVPDNVRGFQNAHTGNAYVGLETFHSGSNEREYIGCQLSQSLIINQKYFVKFYLSLADISSLRLATNHMGVKLSTVPYDVANPIPTDNNPIFYSDSMVTDTAAWIKISGSFIADSAYNYFSLGNFFDNANTDTMQVGGGNQYGYYFVDDICLSTDSAYCETILTDIKNINNSPDDIFLFPNPVVNNLTILKKPEEPFIAEVFDVAGKKISESMLANDSKFIIDFKFLKSGVYLIKISNEKKQFYYKILKLN